MLWFKHPPLPCPSIHIRSFNFKKYRTQDGMHSRCRPIFREWVDALLWVFRAPFCDGQLWQSCDSWSQDTCLAEGGEPPASAAPLPDPHPSLAPLAPFRDEGATGFEYQWVIFFEAESWTVPLKWSHIKTTTSKQLLSKRLSQSTTSKHHVARKLSVISKSETPSVLS